MSDNRFSRRYFFHGTLLAGAVPTGGFGSTPSLNRMGFRSGNGKPNIAAIGIGARGPRILRGVAGSENIVALCGVNDEMAAPAFRTCDKAKRYNDFRKTIETEGKNIDAVMIATPDHTHTPTLRVPGKLLWDAKNMRFTNFTDNEEANKLLRPYIRQGWDLKV